MNTPVFEYSQLEAQAVAVMELLAGRSPSLTLSPEARRPADALVQAYRQGNKLKVHQLTQTFYAQVITPGLCEAAYRLLASQHLAGNPDFQIVMDHLKESYGHTQPLARQLGLDEALIVLLLAITRSDRNSISYNRLDEHTGKLRPTTFPLTEQLMRNFLAPFGDKSALMKRYLIFCRGMVMGNPAAWVAQGYRVRKQAYEQQRAAWEQARQAKEARRKLPAQPEASVGRITEVSHLSQEVAQLIKNSYDEKEKQALLHSLQPDQLLRLVKLTENAKPDAQAHARDFRLELENMYAARLTRAQASYLSARLSSKMKRMLESMGGWKEEYWSEFQTRMQQQGVWEGDEWLEKLRASKKGKQHLTKTGKDYLIEEKSTALDDMLHQAEKIKDKLRGQKMLSGVPDISVWQRPSQIRSTPEQRKVLLILSRPDRLNELINHVFPPATWEALPALLRQRLFEGFTLMGDTDFDTIKSQYLAAAAPDQYESAKNLITALELRFNQISTLFKQDLGMTFSHALEILNARQEDIAQREKQNSRSWQNSAASQYGRYKQA